MRKFLVVVVLADVNRELFGSSAAFRVAWYAATTESPAGPIVVPRSPERNKVCFAVCLECAVWENLLLLATRSWGLSVLPPVECSFFSDSQSLTLQRVSIWSSLASAQTVDYSRRRLLAAWSLTLVRISTLGVILHTLPSRDFESCFFASTTPLIIYRFGSSLF